MDRIITDWRTTVVGVVSGVASIFGNTWGMGLPLTLKSAWPGIVSIIFGAVMKDGQK